LKKQIESDNLDAMRSAEERLVEADLKYHEDKGKKWIVMLISMTILGVIGFFIMPYLYALSHSEYDRTGIQQVVYEYFGDETNINEALTKEVVIVSYEWNSHEPRIFSKYTANLDPPTYNVSITNAAQASSSAPIYFDPKVIEEQVLIDGGVIANEPALYAYLHSIY
jgi:patatin-like phospholipase/acyl hydrolase